MKSKVPLKSKSWGSLFYDKGYVNISWSLTLLYSAWNLPKYSNIALKFTFSLLKDGQRSGLPIEKQKKKKKKKEWLFPEADLIKLTG